MLMMIMNDVDDDADELKLLYLTYLPTLLIYTHYRCI